MMFFFRKARPTDYSRIISILERGDPQEAYELLWQPRNRKLNYLPVTIGIILKLSKSESTNDHLSVHKVVSNGNYELVIFSLPWSTTGLPYAPLIFDKRTSKIVGAVLPFNEVHGHIPDREIRQITDVGMQWLYLYAIPFRFKS